MENVIVTQDVTSPKTKGTELVAANSHESNNADGEMTNGDVSCGRSESDEHKPVAANSHNCNNADGEMTNGDVSSGRSESDEHKPTVANSHDCNNANGELTDGGISCGRGESDGYTVEVTDIICEFEDVHISEPSTSGLHNSTSTLRKVKCPDIDSSDEDDHSHYETVLENYSDVSVSRERPSVLSFKKGKRRVLKVSPDELSSPDSPISEDEANKIFTPDSDPQDDIENEIAKQLNKEQSTSIPELSLEEERSDMRHWKACVIGGVKRQIDMKVIEPYKRVLSHGGYLTSGSHNAIITFSACFLPHRSRVDYNYVMNNLFFYVVYTLNQLVTDDYVLVYLHGGTTKDCIPKFSWLQRCYRMIDRKLKKNLKALYLVHPTFWLKTLVVMIKPFISSKFSRKIHSIGSLGELYEILPIEEASIPDKVKQYDRVSLSFDKQQ